MGIFKKRTNFYDDVHVAYYNATKKMLRKDIFFQFLFFFAMGLLIYAPFDYIFKLAIVFMIYIVIGMKEKNAIEFNSNLTVLAGYKEKLGE